MVSGMPAEQREAALAQMLSYLVPPLQQAVQSNQEGPAVLLIDRITIIFRHALARLHAPRPASTTVCCSFWQQAGRSSACPGWSRMLRLQLTIVSSLRHPVYDEHFGRQPVLMC